MSNNLFAIDIDNGNYFRKIGNSHCMAILKGNTTGLLGHHKYKGSL